MRRAADCATAREVASRADECSSLPSTQNVGVYIHVHQWIRCQTSVQCSFGVLILDMVHHTTFINGPDGSEWKEGGELCIAHVEKHKFCIQALKLSN